MPMQIESVDVFNRCVLSVDSNSVTLSTTGQVIQCRQVDGILRAPDGTLSIQAGKEVIKIKTENDDATHQQVIEALVRYVRKTI